MDFTEINSQFLTKEAHLIDTSGNNEFSTNEFVAIYSIPLKADRFSNRTDTKPF